MVEVTVVDMLCRSERTQWWFMIINGNEMYSIHWGLLLRNNNGYSNNVLSKIIMKRITRIIIEKVVNKRLQ